MKERKAKRSNKVRSLRGDDDFKYLRFEAGFNSREKAADFCGVTVRTVRNWERCGAPVMAVKLMGLLAGDLSRFGEDWAGVRLEPDCVSTGKLDFVYPHEINAMRYLYQAAKIDRSVYVTKSLGKKLKVQGRG